MYKTRLQEVCQQRLWVLPKYTTNKDGPDHNPRFQASVAVGDLSFHGPDQCRSSKEAQNEAARIALDHLGRSSPPPLPPLGSSNANNLANSNTPQKEESLEASQVHVNASTIVKEMGLLCKSQLQSYTQRRNINLPLYDYVREGSLHALRFKAKVTVDGQTFESPHFFSSLKEAENAAAKVALISLSAEGIPEDEPAFFKNLLQELTQKECISTPCYKTVTDGLSHMPTFFSTVEIEGEKFEGVGAKTKKQAEQNAAKVAWYKIKERQASKHPGSFSPDFEVQQEIEIAYPTSIDSQRLRSPSPPISCISHDKDLKGNFPDEAVKIDTSCVFHSNMHQGAESADQEALLSDKSSDSGQSNANLSTPQLVPSWEAASKERGTSNTSDITYSQLRDPILDECTLPEDGSSSSSSLSEGANAEFPSGKHGTSLLSNRIRVYPRKPDMELPDGVTLLPFSDEMWVAVSFDSSN